MELFVAYAGITRLGLVSAWELLNAGSADWSSVMNGIIDRPDFWLWLYLTFAVSSTMLPSTSDRRAWLPVFMSLLFLIVVGVLAGVGPWLIQHLAAPMNQALRAASAVMGISLLVHALFWLPMWLTHRLLARITGSEVV